MKKSQITATSSWQCQDRLWRGSRAFSPASPPKKRWQSLPKVAPGHCNRLFKKSRLDQQALILNCTMPRKVKVDFFYRYDLALTGVSPFLSQRGCQLLQSTLESRAPAWLGSTWTWRVGFVGKGGHRHHCHDCHHRRHMTPARFSSCFSDCGGKPDNSAEVCENCRGHKWTQRGSMWSSNRSNRSWDCQYPSGGQGADQRRGDTGTPGDGNKGSYRGSCRWAEISQNRKNKE